MPLPDAASTLRLRARGAAQTIIATQGNEWHVRRMKTAHFQADQSDLIAAYKLNFRATLKSKRIARSYVGGCAALAGIAALAAWAWNLMSVPLAAVAGAAYWIVFLSAILLSAYLRLPRQVKRIFLQQKSLHEDTTIEWSDSGISFRSARGRSSFEWSDFVLVVIGRDTIIFRQSDALMNFVPVRALTPEQVSDISRHNANS
ncbi:MAG: YcxB family protein [Sphingomonas sp.]|nr:YcxB family protein [Sphingomonas sp.]